MTFSRMSAAEYLKELKSPKGRTRSKYGNIRSGGADSKLEIRFKATLEWQRSHPDPDLCVIDIEQQKRYILVDPQPGERAVSYVADFVVTYKSGRVEVIDTKSPITRRLPAYVIKRKLMLERHSIKIREVEK